MATRKDLLKAQSFTSRRMIAAFVDRDPDDPTPPLRRVVTATFVSVLLGVIILAGTALFGLIRPGGSQAWREEGVIISDTTAGIQFVYVGEQLVPMANVTSARLLAAQHNNNEVPRVVNVKTDSLKGAPQATPHGIPGAPRQLPDASSMKVYPLQLCSSAPTSANDRFLSLEFNAGNTPAGNEFAFVARASNDDEYLIRGGRAHRLWREQGTSSPLIEELPVVTPGSAWLAAIPVGTPIEPVDVPNRGAQPARDTLGMTVGQLAVVGSAEDNRYYIQLDQGLSRISYLDMRLQIAAFGANQPREISENQYAMSRNEEIESFSDLEMPYEKPIGPSGYGSLEPVSVCATYNAEDPSRVSVSVDQPTPEMPEGHVRPFANRLDLVATESLSGGLFRNAATTADDASTFLVTDGKLYPIPDRNSRVALGYAEVEPAPIPGQLLALFEPGLEQNVNLSHEFIVPLQDSEG